MELEPTDTIAALYRWRDVMVEVMRGAGCVGGCPIGSLASELSDTDPLARARLARAFAYWEDLIRDGLAAIAARAELPRGWMSTAWRWPCLRGCRAACCSVRFGATPHRWRRPWTRWSNTSAAWECARPTGASFWS